MAKDSRVPNSSEGGLSDEEHVREAEYFAEGDVSGVNIKGRSRSAERPKGKK